MIVSKLIEELHRLPPDADVPFIVEAKAWAMSLAPYEYRDRAARQLAFNLEEAELWIESREREIDRLIHLTRILAEDLRKISYPISDLHRLFYWPLRLMARINDRRRP